MTTQLKSTLGLLVASLFIVSCATHTVKSTSYTPVVQGSQDTPEYLLLDVGVAIFDPGLDEIKKSEEEVTNHEIRVAESRYAPFLLSETIQRSGNWGIVRVMPNQESPMDVYLNGTILSSNGEQMAVRIEVTDSTGRRWYTKEYEESVSQFSYEASERQKNDPFQVVYNTIANDLLKYRKRNLTDNEITEIRTVSEMLFAQRFSPDVFGEYLAKDRNGNLEVVSLPAESDPLLERVRGIRERDFMFIDTVQDYYATYVRQMR
ncbi:MAG: hypothetical protein ACJATW_001020, partial [Glaciecola sp.]